MEMVVTREFAIKRIREIVLSEAHNRGSELTFAHVAARCPEGWPAQLIAEGCELAGYPVWSSAPDDAFGG
jgi:hypothetical protein